MSRRRLWIAASAGDAAIRFLAQMTTTIVVARLLSPEDFGVALMVLTVVAIFSTLIGQSIEETLAQRQRLVLRHVQAALFVALALTMALLALAPIVAAGLVRMTGVGEIAFWLPVATLLLVGEGPGAVVRALARRHRRFVMLSACQTASVVLASVVAILTATLSPSVLSLILQRQLPGLLFPLLAVAVALAMGRRGMRRSPFVRPAWDRDRFRELSRFSWLHLSVVALEAVTPAAVAYTVNGIFGTAVLGQMNIALRIVDPLRQLIGGVGHNLIFSMLYRMQHDPRRLVVGAAEAVVGVGTFAVPAFLGLAVTAPMLLPLLVGPGWDSAVPLSRALCLAAAIYVPFGFFYSGYSALGRPEYGLAGSGLHLGVILAGLWIARAAGYETGIGMAMIAGELVICALAIGLCVRIAGQAAAPALGRIARVWGAALLMAAGLDLARQGLGPAAPPALELAGIVLAGALLYPLLLIGACRSCLDGLRRTLLPDREPG